MAVLGLASWPCALYPHESKSWGERGFAYKHWSELATRNSWFFCIRSFLLISYHQFLILASRTYVPPQVELPPAPGTRTIAQKPRRGPHRIHMVPSSFTLFHSLWPLPSPCPGLQPQGPGPFFWRGSLSFYCQLVSSLLTPRLICPLFLSVSPAHSTCLSARSLAFA